MKKLWKNNKLLLLLYILTILGIISGILFSATLNEENKQIVYKNVEQLIIQNKESILSNLTQINLYTITIFLLGISIIGIIIIAILYFLKIMILSFEITSFFKVLTWKRSIYIGFYFIPKIFIGLLSFFMTYYSMKISIYLIEYLFLHKKINFPVIIKKYIKILGINIIGNVIISLINYYVIFKILKINT